MANDMLYPRCAQCNKILTLDTYASHQGVIYCKPHHKDLFKPKAVTKDSVEEIMKKNIDFSCYNEDNIGSTPFLRTPQTPIIATFFDKDNKQNNWCLWIHS